MVAESATSLSMSVLTTSRRLISEDRYYLKLSWPDLAKSTLRRTLRRRGWVLVVVEGLLKRPRLVESVLRKMRSILCILAGGWEIGYRGALGRRS